MNRKSVVGGIGCAVLPFTAVLVEVVVVVGDIAVCVDEGGDMSRHQTRNG